MMNTPTINRVKARIPLAEFKYTALNERSAPFKLFSVLSETLRYIGNQKLKQKFQWPETDDIPDEVGLVSRAPIQLARDGNKIHKGQWRGNKRFGRGIEIDPEERSYYIGEWNQDQKDGFGRLVMESGNIYEGYWADNVAHGSGAYYDASGVTYIGDFYRDIQHGHGKEIYPGGKYYKGEFEYGVKNGYGEIVWRNGDKYEGEFVENKISGKGCFTWYDKRKYEGEFLNGKMHGKGSYKWPDGNRYTGEYVKGKKDGWGVYTWVDGREYEGTWKNGSQDGYGFMKVHSKCEPKKGFWKKGQFLKWVDDAQESTTADLEKDN